MLNHSILMGRLTRDPELRRTGSGIAVASFRVAVEKEQEQDPSPYAETEALLRRYGAAIPDGDACSGLLDE